MASQITSLPIVYLTVYSNADQRKHQRSASLVFVGTGKFPAQMASNAENVSIWWRHHELMPSQNGRLSADGFSKWIFLNEIIRISFQISLNGFLKGSNWRPTIIVSGNGVSPDRHQAITWANGDLMSTGALGKMKHLKCNLFTLQCVEGNPPVTGVVTLLAVWHIMMWYSETCL